jgi:hypothetical protein
MVPPVKELRLKAISWKMKNTAIVITMNVCRRTRNATRPNGTAMAAPTAAASGSRANTPTPLMCQSLAAMPTV